MATTASADQFTQMHAILASERARRHEAAWDEDLDGNTPTPDLIDSRQVLRWATIDGARVAGVADRTGSITPGKKADLVIIDTKAVNVAPVIDPVGAVVCAADISNVRTVLVDGRIVKDDFKLKAELDPAAAAGRGLAGLPGRGVRGAGARLAGSGARHGDGHGIAPCRLRAPRQGPRVSRYSASE